jgi:hypothetical protein
MKKNKPLHYMGTPCWFCKNRYKDLDDEKCGPCVKKSFSLFDFDTDIND